MKKQEGVSVSVTHRFSASAERAFDAWLDPEKACKFLFATPTGEMVRTEIDARVGGRFSIVERRAGEDVAHVGTYLEVERPRYSPGSCRRMLRCRPRSWLARCRSIERPGHGSFGRLQLLGRQDGRRFDSAGGAPPGLGLCGARRLNGLAEPRHEELVPCFRPGAAG